MFRRKFLPTLAALGLICASAQAAKPPDDWTNFAASYVGGYSVANAKDSADRKDGPANILIRLSADKKTALMTWTNTYYNEKGSFRQTMRWKFRWLGPATTKLQDPLFGQGNGRGNVLRARSGRIVFESSGGAGTNAFTLKGLVKMVGGGAISITATAKRADGQEVTYSFSGGRVFGS